MKKFIIIIFCLLAFVISSNAQTQKRVIYFDYAKWDLLPLSFEQLDQVYELLIKYPQMEIEIHGHTDSRGSDEDNQKLSQNRVKSVYKYLVGRGIDESRMKYIGFGENRPCADNSTEDGRALNRRVEIITSGQPDVTVTDNNGCTATTTANITQPASALTAINTNLMSALTNGLSKNVAVVATAQNSSETTGQATITVQPILVSSINVQSQSEEDIIPSHIEHCDCQLLRPMWRKWNTTMKGSPEREALKTSIYSARRCWAELYRGITRKNTSTPITKTHPRKGGLAHEKSKRFWKNIAKIFKSIGACRKAAR